MDTTKNLHDVSATVFFVLAFVYVVAALAFRNNFMSSFMVFLMRLLDIPFVMTALLYGGTGLSLQINEGKEDTGSVWNIIIFAACLILFGAVVFINFAFKSAM